MFKFIKQIAISAMILFNSLLNVNPLECISLKNQECKVRPEIINISSNDPIFYSFSIKANKCSGNCNNISNLYARICIPDTVKSLNVKIFKLMSSTNETRYIECHESCKCRLDPIICNSKQRWNEDKCSCECKEFIEKGVCDKGFIWNPSYCECECDKSCNTDEYLDYSNCKCKKKLFDKLIEECTENIDVVKIGNENENENEYSFSVVYIVCIVLFSIIIVISIGIVVYLFSLVLKKM